MQEQTFVNQKLEFVEELVLHTDAHIFLTGRAGTGKTTFLKSLPSKTAKRMAVVAPTGVAAINAGGQTIHSFFQLPFGPQIPEDPKTSSPRREFRSQSLASQFQKIRKQKLQLMRGLDLLIIDEISMVRADVLDAVDAVLRRARRSSRPFGGLQLLMIGDVHQLAPVAKPEEWEVLAPYYDTTYFFGSHVLRETPYVCVELDHIYRQHDSDFIRILNKVRDNQMDAECIELLNSRYKPDFVPKESEGYITLTTHNYQADQINGAKLEALKGRKLLFEAEVDGIFSESMYPTKETLELKVGAQVMFIKNDPNPEKEYYNGKIGILTDYDEKEGTVEVLCGSERITVPRVRWPNMEYRLNEETQVVEEQEIGSFVQIPLRLAWAVTIHKSQGLTFDKLIVDAGQAFAHGQVYVALSRCTSLEGLVLKTRISPSALFSDYKVDGFVGQIPEREPSREKVDRLRHQYELENMLELIDFQAIYRDVGRLAGIVMSQRKRFEGAMLEDLAGRMERVRTELCNVGEKFAKQVQQLHQEAMRCEQNPALQERVTKGAAYFMEHLDQTVNGVLDLPLKTDNKALNEQIMEALKRLGEDIYVKRSCLEACRNGFSAEEYQKAKSSALLRAEKKENQPVAIRAEIMEKSTLHAALSAWRSEKADEEGVELYNIVPNATLKDIARNQPVTLRELKVVEGMGPKRIKRFGEEIIAIVRQFSDRAVVDEEPEELPAKKKQKKGNTFLITRDMVKKGMSAEEIATERKLALSTIYGHFARLVSCGEFAATDFVAEDKVSVIKEYFRSTEDTSLAGAREVLGDDYEFWELRIVLDEMREQ